MILKKKLVLLIVLLVFIILLNGCFLSSGVKIKEIKYVFYTTFDRPVDEETKKLLNFVQGEELNQWADPTLDIQPTEFDIVVTLKNEGFLKVKPSNLHVEFWLLEAKEINEKDNSLDLEKMKSIAKWNKYWAKDIELQEFKPNEIRKIIVKRVGIASLDQNEYDQKGLILMGWNCKVISGQVKIEKPLNKSFLH